LKRLTKMIRGTSTPITGPSIPGYPDGATSCTASKPEGERRDLAVWSMPLNGAQYQARRWTDRTGTPAATSAPVPLSSGGLLLSGIRSTNRRWCIRRSITRLAPWARQALTARPMTAANRHCRPTGRRLPWCARTASRRRARSRAFNGSASAPARATRGPAFTRPRPGRRWQGLAYSRQGQTGPFQLCGCPCPCPPHHPSVAASRQPRRVPQHPRSGPTPTPAPVRCR